MNEENKIFDRYTINYEELKRYGFVKRNDKYIFNTYIMNKEFRLEITIIETGEISSKVYETDTNEEFLPFRIYAPESTYVSAIKTEYYKILDDIKMNCIGSNYFTFNQSNRIASYVISTYQDKPEYLWINLPDCAAFRNHNNKKWYGIIGKIDYSKLGKDNNDPVEVLNIKVERKKVKKLLKLEGFYPAWHMNKTNWVSITLDNTLPDDEIIKLLDESYSFTIPAPKADKVKIGNFVI